MWVFILSMNAYQNADTQLIKHDNNVGTGAKTFEYMMPAEKNYIELGLRAGEYGDNKC